MIAKLEAIKTVSLTDEDKYRMRRLQEEIAGRLEEMTRIVGRTLDIAPIDLHGALAFNVPADMLISSGQLGRVPLTSCSTTFVQPDGRIIGEYNSSTGQ